MKGDLVDLVPPEEKDHDEAILQALLQHFYREGNFAMGDALATELQSMTDAQWKEPFEEMHHLVEALDRHDIGPAISWIERASKATKTAPPNNNGKIDGGSNGSMMMGESSISMVLPSTAAAALTFKLHSLAYIDMLKGGSWSQAIQYARTHLAPLAKRFPHDVETLLGAMAFAQGVGGLECSPYAPLLREELWTEAEESLVASYCACRGLARESALRLALNLGTMAWPKISRVLAIMKHRPGVEWDPAEELPVEIETGEQAKFHSVFVCPVLRQQSTEGNPPMMMPCGHVISQEALHRLCKGNPNYRIKCPYCPAESTANSATRLYF